MFMDAEGMLESIQREDFYNTCTGAYVCPCDENGSIRVYHIPERELLMLLRSAQAGPLKSLAPLIRTAGALCPAGDGTDRLSALEYCMDTCRLPGWVSLAAYRAGR
jgi:hypothetical protein